MLHQLMMKKKDQSATIKECLKKQPVTVEEIRSAEVEMIKAVQAKFFEREIQAHSIIWTPSLIVMV